MQSLRPIHILLLLPLFTLVAALPGCNEEVKGKKRPYTGGGDETFTKTAIEPKAYGTITGKVTYDGTPVPVPEPVQMGNNEAACHAGAPAEENNDMTWLIDANKGVKNAVVILQPGEGKFFKIPESQMKVEDINVYQPRCAFIPRVVTLFPQYYDAKTSSYAATNQKLIIHNNAPFDHNYNLLPNGEDNTAKGGTLRRGDVADLTGLVPQPKPIIIKCDIHNWMRCYGFLLDHPYAAVTKADGTFEIKNAPLGIDVQVVCWHEGAPNGGFFNGGQGGKKAVLEDKQQLNLGVHK
jgi:hypothetical protein